MIVTNKIESESFSNRKAKNVQDKTFRCYKKQNYFAWIRLGTKRSIFLFYVHGVFIYSNIKKWGISKNEHVINFKIEKEPKMKFFDFGAFQKIRKMLSHDFWGIS